LKSAILAVTAYTAKKELIVGFGIEFKSDTGDTVIVFQAIVGSRTSGGQPGGPPGEAEVLSLNPQRLEKILKATGWKALIPGTLNLEVVEDSVHQLLLCTPLIREKGEAVKYPQQYAHIPTLRVGYLYYWARIKKGEEVATVLIRRACNPLKNRLEAFSELNLRSSLSLSDGEKVVCEIDEQLVEQPLRSDAV
jgi:hypothetical protein